VEAVIILVVMLAEAAHRRAAGPVPG
jgi:hypothetical protein